MHYRLQVALGLISIAIIAFQLALMQILSIVQWHHYAYMVISVALLGFGASGTILTIFRAWFLNNYSVVCPLLMILCGTTMSLVVGISQLPFIRFDSYLLFNNISHIGRLMLTYLIFFIPFFCGALAIGLIFIKFIADISKLYFANLLGSGIGGILILGLIWQFTPGQLPSIIAVFPILGGVALVRNKTLFTIGTAAGAGIIISIAIIINPPSLVISEFKSLSKTLELPDAAIKFQQSTPYGLTQIVTSPALRYAPGLSLNYRGPVPSVSAVFNDGNWFGPIINMESVLPNLMQYTTNELPYIIGHHDKILVLNAGTGRDVLHALTKNAKRIMATEPNKMVIDLLNERDTLSRSIYKQPSVALHPVSAINFLLTNSETYDMISIPMVDAFGGTSGLYSLQEQYLLTIDAMELMWKKLKKDGVLSISVWMDYPFRNPLKILATIVDMLSEQGIQDPSDHIASVRSWGTITFTVKKSPLVSRELSKIRAFADTMSFDPVIFPEIDSQERQKYNKLQDEDFFRYIDIIISSEKKRHEFYELYDFDIRPATINKPYYAQFLRIKSLPNVLDQYDKRTFPFLEIGYLIVIITLVQITLAALVFIIFPLFKIGWKSGLKLWTITYFSCLGIGYLFIEIILIQRFTLYFANPIYSAAAVISALLIFSGAGSYFSSRLRLKRGSILKITGVIVILLICYGFLLMPVLENTIALPLALKLLLAFIIIGPLSFFMGMPFPVGLKYLTTINENDVPWAWGINGCFSVISTALATIIAVEFGFMAVILVAAGAYTLALLSSIGLSDQS